MVKNMRNRFDTQLELLNEQLIHMGELCESAIENATKALEEGDMKLARKVIVADDEIDRQEKDIENLCLKLLLQQQPVAKDLRQISAALKIITDMERIGDQTADIADIIMEVKFEDGQSFQDIGLMAEATAKMVRNSVAAYVQKDLELARKVMLADDEVDAMFLKIKRELMELISKQENKHTDQAIDLIMITKYLERIGDHATNIAEWVEFSITGTHVGGEGL